MSVQQASLSRFGTPRSCTPRMSGYLGTCIDAVLRRLLYTHGDRGALPQAGAAGQSSIHAMPVERRPRRRIDGHAPHQHSFFGSGSPFAADVHSKLRDGHEIPIDAVGGRPASTFDPSFAPAR